MSARNNPFAVLFENDDTTNLPIAAAVKPISAVASSVRRQQPVATTNVTADTTLSGGNNKSNEKKLKTDKNSFVSNNNKQRVQKTSEVSFESKNQQKPINSESSSSGAIQRRPKDSRSESIKTFRTPTQRENYQTSKTVMPASDNDEKNSGRHQNDGKSSAHRAPAHGRVFDRHSGTGKYDSKKKEVAGPSWGPAVDVPAHSTTEQALEVVENNEDKTIDQNGVSNLTVEEIVPTKAEITTVTLEEYMREQRKNIIGLRKKPTKARKPIEDNLINEVQTLSAKQKIPITLLGLFAEDESSPNKQPTLTKTKRRVTTLKEKRVLVELPFAPYRPAFKKGDYVNDGSLRGPPRQRRENAGTPTRPQPMAA